MNSGSQFRPPTSARAAFRAAVDGLRGELATERHLKVHVIAAMAVMVVGMGLAWPASTRTAWLFAVALVLGLELLNSALEAVVDLVQPERHPLARRAKDAAAGAVLIAATAAALSLVLGLEAHWALVRAHLGAVTRSVALGVPMLALLGVTLFRPSRRAGPRYALAGIGLSLSAALGYFGHSAACFFGALFLWAWALSVRPAKD